jgi:hypothetical protein
MAGTLPARVSASARLTHYVPRADAARQCRDCAIRASCPDAVSIPAETRTLHDRIRDVRERAGMPADLCLYNSDKDTFDHGMAQVEFDNDVLGVYTVNVISAFTDRRMRVSGVSGTLDGQLGNPAITYWRRDAPQKAEACRTLQVPSSASGGHGGGDAALLDDFAAFVRGQPSRALGPLQASVAVAMGLAATQSSDSGRTVEMSAVDGWTELRAMLQQNAGR